MPGLKSRIIYLLLRNRHLFRGKSRREVFDFNTSIDEFREQCERGAAKHTRIPPDVRVEAAGIPNIRSEWLIPASADPRPVILYVHGGGYVSGSCDDHRGIVAKFAKNCGVRTLQFEYALAPEHPFPRGLDEAVGVYRWLLDKDVPPGEIVLAGESAGGGLVLAMLLAFRERNIPMPAAAVAISPWTDLTCASESYRSRNRRSLAPLNSWTVFSKYYAGEHPPGHPLISPLFGDPHGLPPLFINAGEDDELFDDGRKFAEKARDAGVDVTFVAGEGMVHCYPLFAPLFREATQAMDEICSFVRKALDMKLSDETQRRG